MPLPRDDSSRDEALPVDPVETPRAFDARSATSADRDPWARVDPWSANRYPRRQDYGAEDEFLQFVEWRAARDRGATWTNWNGGWQGNGNVWQAARDEQERTTAGPPPEWDGVEVDFKDYKLKAKIWLRTTRTPAHARGPLLLKNLSKGPWEDLKFLASDESWLSDPANGNRLIDLMDSREFYGEEKRESMLAACSRLTFHLKRQRGESARSFMTRWDTAERKVREHEVKLPPEFLGFLMVNALQLDSEKTKLLLNYTKGALTVADVKEWLRIHETDLDLSHLGTEKKKSQSTSNYLLDFDNASEIQLMDATEYAETESTEPTEILMAAVADLEDEESVDPEVILTEGETKEILMTMIKDGKGKGKGRSYAGALKAKKNRDLARGFGAGRDGMLRPGTYEVSISELKKRTKCNKCGQVGHWARECSSQGRRSTSSQGGSSDSGRSGPKPKEVNFLSQDLVPESEFFFLTSDPIEEGNEGERQPVFYDGRNGSDLSDDYSWLSRDYMQRPQPHPCFHIDTCYDLACATIDTGCQRMAIGLNTLLTIIQTQPSELPVTYQDELHQFRSVHQVSCTHRLACIPCSLGPKGCILRPALFEEQSSADAPFLLSLPFLLHCRATLILDEQQGLSLISRKFGFKVQCFLGPTGALRIPIQQFTREMIQTLSQQVSTDSREYELLRTEHCSTTLHPGPRFSAPTGQEDLTDQSPFPGAINRDISLSNDGRTYKARANRIDHISGHGRSGLGSHGSEVPLDHRSGNWASCDDVSGHGGATRSSSSSDDRVKRATGCTATRCGGDSLGPATAGAIIARGKAENPIASSNNVYELVKSDLKDYIPANGTSSDSEVKTTEFHASNSGLPYGINVGGSYRDEPSEGCPSLLLPQAGNAVCVQDGEESQPSLLAMPQSSQSSVHFLPMVGSTESSSGTTSSRDPGINGGMADETSTRSLPTWKDHEGGIQCILPPDPLPGLRTTTGEGSNGLPESEVRDRVEGRDSKYAGRDEIQDEHHGEGVRRVSGLAQSADSSDARSTTTDRRFSSLVVSPTKEQSGRPLLVNEVRAGLRRHIYGCLKRSEQCWLDIFQLLCSPEDEQSQHLETTCAVIRKSLQLQQPHMKQLSELYALQPKQLKTIAEICNPNRFGGHADVFGLRSGQAFDLELGWNLLDRKQQSYVRSYILTEKPGLVILSPPCTKFSMLLNLSYPKWCGDPTKFEKHLKELRQAKELLRFCAEICELCRQIGTIFVFEHPWSASSWNERCLRNLLTCDDVHLARTDQCEFDLLTEQGEFMRKRSGFLTNSITIAEALNKTCQKSHDHCHVMGRAAGSQWNRSRLAQKYPYPLVAAILTAYVQTVGLSTLRPLYFIDAEAVIKNDLTMAHNWYLGGEDLPLREPIAELYAVSSEPPDSAEVEVVNPYREKSFPGTHPLSLEALVRRAHEGLGHPGRERFLRILTNSKASKKVLEIAKNLHCSVCEKFKLPKPARAGAPPKEVGLNEIVGVDTIQVRAPFSKKTKYCLNIVDYSSHFQLIVPLVDHTAQGARAGYRMWLKIFGPPRKLLCDLGKEFRKEFEHLAESDGSELLPSSLETPEQRGLVERQGQLFKTMFAKTLEEINCENWDQWHQTIDIVCCTKNRLLSRGGFSPAQRVFGYQQRIPGGLMSEGEGDLAVQSLAASGDVTVARAMDIRRAASIAFHEIDCQQAVRAAATHGPRPHYNYETGQAVYFWRRGTDPARRSANYFWHGPARVVATQLPTTVWLSYNHHLVKAAPEKIRPAAEEEFASLSGWLEGISNAKKQFETSKIQGMIDLSEDPTVPLNTEEEQDYWRREGHFWVRVHLQPRTRLFRPDHEPELPFDLDSIQTIRRTLIKLPGGEQKEIEDQWSSGADQLPDGDTWTGETWFTDHQGLLEDAPVHQKPYLPPPEIRVRKKSRPTTVPELPNHDPIITPDPQVPPPPGLELPDPETITNHSYTPTTPRQSPPEPEDMEVESPAFSEEPIEDRKRDLEVDSQNGKWEELPASKRLRLDLLEIYHTELVNKSAQRQKKGKEARHKDFSGRDAERLQRAIHKEFNNNLATGAYELLSPSESVRIRKEKPSKIMKSRYVLTKKPIEDFALEDARSADDVLDSGGPEMPCKAKCRHVMQGYSEADLLDLETSTPQVHRDSVIFAAQLMATMNWTPGFADFTQAFHSGDPIDRELYAEQPQEGLPGAAKGQILRLKKTCYGLTDGPYAWYKHIVRFITETLGYRQSIVDSCLFYLDSEEESSGQTRVDGVIALATDDLFHGGNQRHMENMEKIRQTYKLGKYTWKQGRFVGKDVTQLEDGSILLDQKFYLESKLELIPISRERKRRRFSPCTALEVEQLRTLVGVLSWVSKETRCDLAGKTAILQQSFPRPLIKDLIAGNQLATEALSHKELGIRLMPIPLHRLRAGVVTDASWGNSKEFGTYLEPSSQEDWWEETATTWIRHHGADRTVAFHPAAAPGGPDLHDLLPDRQTELVMDGTSKPLTDEWTTANSLRTLSTTPWKGSTTFWKQPTGSSLDPKLVHTGYEQLAKLFSQGGEIVIFYDESLPVSQQPQQVSLAAWKSYRLKRRTVNTLSSETQALVRGLGSIHWFRVLILEARGLALSARDWQREVARLPFICVTDSKSLYDTVRKCTNPASQCEDKRTSIDVALIKQELQDLEGTIRWIDGRTMIADPLTKESKADYLRYIIQHGQWSILEEGAALQQKLVERQGQEILFVI